MKVSRNHHKLCRPPKNATEVERLLMDGRWIPDDGKPGLAFSGRSAGIPFAWKTKCDCSLSDRRREPCYLALDRTCDRYRCANGADVPSIRSSKTRKL